MTGADKFHSHLDKCAQCANHPFNLCHIGARLLIDAAGDEAEARMENAMLHGLDS